MILIILQVFFQQKAVTFSDKSVNINHVINNYNPLMRNLQIDPPSDTIPAYIFMHVNEKISDLEVNGDFGNAQECGLVWNQAKTRIFNVLLEMKTSGGQIANLHAVPVNFAVVRWAQRIVVSNCFFDVEKAFISLDVFEYFSITQSSFIAIQLLHNQVPMLSFIRGDAMFTGDQQLFNAPAELVEGCSGCPPAALGAACAHCRESTVKTEQADCKCRYFNFDYLEFQDSCIGTAQNASTEVVDEINGINMTYFMECNNNHAYFVKYDAKNAGNTRISFFRDDTCGLSNIFLNGSIETDTSVLFSSEVAGFVFVKTTNIANSTINISVINKNKKLLSMTLFARNATKNINLTNMIISGVVSEVAHDRTSRKDIHMNLLFHYLDSVVLTIRGLLVYNSSVSSYYDGIHSSLGIGTAIDSSINLFDVYYGKVDQNVVNPLLQFDFGQDYNPSANCTDKMSTDMLLELVLFENMPKQTSESMPYLHIDSKYSAGLVGLLQSSTLNMNRTVIAIRVLLNGQSAYAAIVAYDVLNSEVNMRLTSLHGFFSNQYVSAALGHVDGGNSRLSINACLNLTASGLDQGFVGIFDNGLMKISIYLNVSLSGQNNGGIAGSMNGGQITLEQSFGAIKAQGLNSGNEVGLWTGGQFDDQACDGSTSCILGPPETSFVNVPNKNGMCNTETSGGTPIGSPGRLYFHDCRTSITLRVSWKGEVSAGTISIFNPDSDCMLINVNVTGNLTLLGNANVSFSMVQFNALNASTIYVDMNVDSQSTKGFNFSLVANNNQGPLLQNIILKGSIKTQSQYQYGNVGGCIGYASRRFEIDQMAVYGLVLDVVTTKYCAIVCANQNYAGQIRNLVIDDFSKAKTVPLFDKTPQQLPADFRCGTEVQDSVLLSYLYLRNLLVAQTPTKRSKIIIRGYVISAGALVGDNYGQSSYNSISIIVETDYVNADTQTGAAIGYIFMSITLNQAYIDAVTINDKSGVIGVVYDTFKVNAAIKYLAKGSGSGVIRQLKYSSQTYYLLLDVTLTKPQSAGLIVQDGGRSFTARTIYGTVIKNCDECYSAVFSSRKDTVPNMKVTNDETCLPWT